MDNSNNSQNFPSSPTTNDINAAAQPPESQTPTPTWPLSTSTPNETPAPPESSAPQAPEVLATTPSPFEINPAYSWSSPTPTENHTPPSNSVFPSWNPQTSAPLAQESGQPNSSNSVFPTPTFTQTPTQTPPPPFSPPGAAPADPAQVNPTSGPLTLNPTSANSNPFTPTDHSFLTPQAPDVPQPLNSSPEMPMNSESALDKPLNLNTPDQTPPANTFTPPPSTPQSAPADLSSLTENSDSLSSPLYTPPLTGAENLTIPTAPAGLPETLTTAKKGFPVSKKLLMIGGAILVLVTAGSLAYFLGFANNNGGQETLSLPAEQQEPLTNPPKPVKTEAPVVIIATASPSATPKVATQSALEKLKSLKQSSSSGTQSGTTR